MKGCIWSYTEKIERKNSTGVIGIYVVPAKNQVMKINIVGLYSAIGQDVGGTSNTIIHTQVDVSGLWLDFVHLSGHEPIDVQLPNQDILGVFDTTPLESIYITDKDRLKIARTYQGAGALMEIAIRAILSDYSIPTVTYYDANIARHSHYSNRIIGEIK